MNRFLSAVAAALLAVSPAFAADKFKLDGENTTIEFTGTKKDGKHTGGFKKVSGEVTNDDGCRVQELRTARRACVRAAHDPFRGRAGR